MKKPNQITKEEAKYIASLLGVRFLSFKAIEDKVSGLLAVIRIKRDLVCYHKEKIIINEAGQIVWHYCCDFFGSLKMDINNQPIINYLQTKGFQFGSQITDVSQ
ncbi:MAG: hypothetical protein NTX66_02060 [Candidatus Falkowbacteria bacterium]|nr:hypothetical protein [Candidatus Falkowbacteria bacterium]